MKIATEHDIATLKSRDPRTLEKWWCELNKWEWPADLAPEESRDAQLPSRRSDIMKRIEKRIGKDACLDEWNKQHEAVHP